MNTENNEDKAVKVCHKKPGFMRKLKMKLRMKRGGWWQRKRLNKITAKLDLESSQREGLEAVFSDLNSLKASAFSSRENVGAGLAAAMQGDSFDNDAAREALKQPIDTMQSKMDATVASFAKWFNELNQSQQQQLREMLNAKFQCHAEQQAN